MITSWHSTDSVWLLMDTGSGVNDIGFKVYETKGAAKRARRFSKGFIVEMPVWKEGRGDG